MKKILLMISVFFLMLNSCKTKQTSLGDFKICGSHMVRGDTVYTLDTLKADTLKHKCCSKK
jgi:hypothetical protein